jgi:peptidoglycan hydrolase CwlO-like protein
MSCPERHLPGRIQKKLLLLIAVLIAVFLVGAILPNTRIHADEVQDLQKQIDDLEHLRQLSEAATAPLEQEVASLDQKIANARAGIVRAKQESEKLAAEIAEREKELDYQYVVLSKRIAEQYKKARTFSPLLMILSSTDAKELTKDLAYRSSVKAQDNRMIHTLGADIANLQTDKKKHEENQIALARLEQQLDEQADFFKGEIEKAKDYQQILGSQIAELSARQQEIINKRSGGFTASIGSSEMADDYLASIKGFRESAPGGYFAVFSFGGYTHRKGMSQYGARGRAKSGQNYKQILKAYYGKEPVDKDTSGKIKVSGYGSMDFETDYLYGIAEMPSSWDKEALKAQAVAARTYAYRYMKEGKEICTTEACQVFNKSKSSNPPESWKQAVKETKGKVLEDVVTYYASTHGGYASPIGWDTTDGKGGSNFLDKAYDKIGGSPWLYKAWWREGYSGSGNTCGRSNPWLSPEEMADIVNAHLVLTKGSSSEAEKISPVTTSCWGGDPYSHSELREVAKKYGGISSANSVSVKQGNGTTTTVTINGVSMSGAEFKKAFNLRAPGNLRIPQSSFAFFNIEKK